MMRKFRDRTSPERHSKISIRRSHCFLPIHPAARYDEQQSSGVKRYANNQLVNLSQRPEGVDHSTGGARSQKYELHKDSESYNR